MSAALVNRDVGKQPISSDRPAGDNPREGDAFAALKAQIDQLTDIHANAPMDWGAVVTLANQVLGQEGKDLAAGAWLAAGLLETAGLQGLAAGIHVLRDLVETYWDDMSPPAARLRGRRNQMQWLLDHLGERLQPGREGDAPLPAETYEAMLADWEALDAAWQSHDEEAPAFYGLRSTLRALPVQAAPEPAAPAEAAPAPAATEASAAVPAVAAQQATATAVAAPATPATTAVMAPPPAAAVVPAAGGDPQDAAETALAGLRPLIDWYLQTQPTQPLLFRINRICAWAALDSLPPVRAGATLLMPPPMQTVDGFKRIAQTAEPDAVVQFAESHLIAHRYWLDLNRASHAALIRLGATQAAATVAFETARMLERLPGLQDLKFSDGQPFADAETRAWLEGLGGAAQPAAGKDGDELAALSTAAEADAAAGNLDEALDRLQQAARRSEGARARFRLRLAQCALLHRFDGRADIRPLLMPLIEELDAHRLPSWEPELARQTLALAAAVELRYGADDAGSSSALARLASVDCRAAWQLSQSTAAA
ncbi:type VI secretion system protein TssA [Bordetella bronchialis]|uniref:Type VI secretion system ImpA domain-containing protein n=2 Tax=Bordetella bronchialis TaxID=463025 RepID=A0ABN4RBT7_9BORD|nr:type VI secretion system protein TssA [Bordetella bronchialis]ANN68524.1 type VI secretion system ImpA domain-containing protein [Bordetella bronchialis]